MNGYNRNGGLTFVPMPGFENLAKRAAEVTERYGEKTGKGTTVDIALPEFGERSNGEPFVRLGKTHIGGHDVIVFVSGPGDYKTLMRLLILLRYLSGRRASRICIAFGYFPLSRSDKDEGSLEFALPPLIMDLLTTSADGKLDRIIAVDIHSPQLVMAGHTGMITPVSMASRVLYRAMSDALAGKQQVCLFYPDDGAEKNFERATNTTLERLDSPSVLYGKANKRRTDSTKARVHSVDAPTAVFRDTTVICIDDEGATLGTVCNLAHHLKTTTDTRRFWCSLTHGVFCGDALRKLSDPQCPIDRIYVSNTIPFDNRPEFQKLIDNGKIIVIDWAEDAGKMAFYHHWDDPEIRTIR